MNVNNTKFEPAIFYSASQINRNVHGSMFNSQHHSFILIWMSKKMSITLLNPPKTCCTTRWHCWKAVLDLLQKGG